MRTTYALSFAAFGQYVAAQAFDAAAVAAASPSQVGPATVATTKTYSYSVNTPVASASIAAQLAPASAAAPPSKAFSNEKRQYYNADPVYTVKVCRKKSSSYSPITYVPSTSTGNPYQPTTLTSTITTTISSSTYSPTTVTSTTTTTITTSSSTTSSSTSSSTDITTSTSTTTSDTTTSSSTTETSTTLTTVTTTSTTTTSESACPTQIEDGTFCGFINPQDPCAPQPSSAGGPKVQPDTVDAFLAYPDFETQSENAVTPAGYESVFTNLQGAVAGGSYITFKPLDTYDVQGCADFCDATDLCTSFNIYIERDPSINPSTPANLDPTVFGNDCPNPSSITNYKCTLWGSALSADQATNVGQKRIDFDVVVTGSNGYDKTSTTTPPVQALFAAPVDLKSRAINKAAEFSLGSKFFPGPFDPSLCTLYAAAQTAANKAAAKDSGLSSFSPVNMFNAVYVYKDDVAWGTYCALFDNVLDESYADFAGVIVDGEELKVGQSFTYAREVFDTGRLRK